MEKEGYGLSMHKLKHESYPKKHDRCRYILSAVCAFLESCFVVNYFFLILISQFPCHAFYIYLYSIGFPSLLNVIQLPTLFLHLLGLNSSG